jgi:oxygen-dependent protoporphyrinogen oxidase
VTRVAVVGGGIAGLAAALRLRDRLGPATEIILYEQARWLGGKLCTGSVGGLAVELGADAFLAREPGKARLSAAVELVRRVGLGAQLVHPQRLPSALVVDGRLRPVPSGTMFGIPANLGQVAELVDLTLDRDRAPAGGPPLLAPGEDVAVGELVRRRLGDQLVDRLVDTMLGGVYAGRADRLSLAATMPGLAAACASSSTLVGAVRTALLAAAPRQQGAPAFAAVHGGMSRFAGAVAAASRMTLRVGRPVRELTATGSGWRLALAGPPEPGLPGAGPEADAAEADGVVLAVPAGVAAELLRGVDESAAELVGEVEYASVALVTFAFPAGVELPPWTGFLVPATEGTIVKAATFLTDKWPHLRGRGDPVVIRASVGRYGEEEPLRLADDALVARVHEELSRLLGGLPEPVATQVQRWDQALPQYAPGHLDRVARARAALPATVRLAGAGYDGVGIPACVKSGQAAADQLADALTAPVEESET